MTAIMHLGVLCMVLLAVTVSAKNVPSVVRGKQINDVSIVHDIQNFARSHPGTKIIPMKKEESMGRTQSVRYTLGGRVSGDSLVAQGTDTFSYAAPNDLNLQLSYPENGTGAIVTFVELVAIQNNNLGNAYVVSGGIGQRSISIIIEAQETDYFSYKAQYFGID
ncbi:uncharacterized protein LOC129946600 [Eupeodes corollae]|uniref:uncharacterized protein LOC129946600 n=1 Tax=Eupeodes corollae TaxID=290404 RepID=UPI002492CA43|nr:uncharacterized protein LOC129946600 [Eupeodes corollae]